MNTMNVDDKSTMGFLSNNSKKSSNTHPHIQIPPFLACRPARTFVHTYPLLSLNSFIRPFITFPFAITFPLFVVTSAFSISHLLLDYTFLIITTGVSPSPNYHHLFLYFSRSPSFFALNSHRSRHFYSSPRSFCFSFNSQIKISKGLPLLSVRYETRDELLIRRMYWWPILFE